MVSEQVTKAYNIFKVIDIMSGSLVFKAAIHTIKTIVSNTLNGDNKLRNDWKYFSTTFLEHVEDTLHSQESVWVLLLSDTLEENGQVMMII
jgi:hypothetical protein